jgi:hypothetical protein
MVDSPDDGQPEWIPEGHVQHHSCMTTAQLGSLFIERFLWFAIAGSLEDGTAVRIQ